MGVRKRQSAELHKEAKKSQAFAKLLDVPSSPRKMRLVVDMIRGKEVFRALGILKFSNKEAVANWEAKNERKAESGELYISTIFVGPAPMLKRLRPAPQGRGYRIRKRANHVTVFVDTIENNANQVNK